MNYYKEAIAIYMDAEKKGIKDELLLEVLKSCPGAICKAAQGVEHLKCLYTFDMELTRIAKSSKINAIKKHRARTGCTLLESKRYIEGLTINT
jgi:ribosomal protein L7/L12